jgi:hypothetical protein
MKEEAPEKIYYAPYGDIRKDYPITDNDIEYVSSNAFIEKAKKWFKNHPETYDANGVRCYSEEDFEDFKRYMEESKL